MSLQIDVLTLFPRMLEGFLAESILGKAIESKLLGVLASDFRPATDDEIRAAFGAGGGSLGPLGVDVEVVADDALREGQYVAGANRDGWHLRGVEAGRDFQPRFADIRTIVDHAWKWHAAHPRGYEDRPRG